MRCPSGGKVPTWKPNLPSMDLHDLDEFCACFDGEGLRKTWPTLCFQERHTHRDCKMHRDCKEVSCVG